MHSRAKCAHGIICRLSTSKSSEHFADKAGLTIEAETILLTID
jgi:hypothetical protein